MRSLVALRPPQSFGSLMWCHMSSSSACPSCGVSSSPTRSPPSPASAASIHAPFARLSRETRELYLRGSDVAVLSGPPSPLSFYRDYVSANLPVVIRDALDGWAALDKWRSNDYLRRTMGEQLVTVACTPTGRADSVQDGVLMLPCEERWSFGRFMDYIERRHTTAATGAAGEVRYLQAQNASFSSEHESLHDDVGPLEWASVAFNDAPDAVNLWMGNSHSLTTLHQDAYENIYAVVTGQKTFLLFPPTDLYWLDERTYPVGRYVRTADGALQPTRDRQASDVPWVVNVEQQLRDMEVEREQRDEQQQQREHEEEDKEDAVDGGDEGECDSGLEDASITEEMRRKYGKSAHADNHLGTTHSRSCTSQLSTVQAS